jgi:hypothetical protein
MPCTRAAQNHHLTRARFGMRTCGRRVRGKPTTVPANRRAERRLAYGILTGMLVCSNCEGSAVSSSAGSSATGNLFVAPESPLQACVEYCNLANEHCGRSTECDKECAAEMFDATSLWEDAVGLKYACFSANSSPGKCKWDRGVCWAQQVDAARCLLEHGCWSWPHRCEPSKVFLDQCTCEKTCKAQLHYGTSCTPDFGVTHCDCYIDGSLAGNCEQVETDLTCDVWTSCCRQYFDL